MTDYKILPTNHEPRPDELRLVETLIHHRSQTCELCSSTEFFSEIWDVYLFRHSRMLKRASRLTPGVPVGVTKLPTKMIPICFKCVRTLEDVIEPRKHHDEAEWRATLGRKEAELAAERAAAKRRQPPTLDSL